MAQTNILLEAGTNELEIVEFCISEPGPDDGGEYVGHYGVNVAKVLEIIRMPVVTALPNTSHPAILGAFTLRSQVIPLVDLAMWLGKERVKDAPPKVIVTEFNRVTTAFLVSGVERIHRISWEEVEPPGHFVARFSGQSITGVVKIKDKIIFLLDLEAIVGELNPGLAMRLDESLDLSSGQRYRALVADDSNLVREMLKDLLRKANFEVETVHNGQECWDRLSALKNQAARENVPASKLLQVVISDIEMPSMDGHHLTRRIKEDPVLKELPVILFSSLITEKLFHKGQAVGADDQISKPEVSQLAVRAKELIRSRLGIEH